MDNTTLALFVFGVLVVISIIIDERLSYRDFPSDFRQAWYTLFLGVALKWGFDLMLAKDWGDLFFVCLLALLLVIGLIVTIRNKRVLNIRDQDYLIKTISTEMKNSIKEAVKEALKEDKEERK